MSSRADVIHLQLAGPDCGRHEPQWLDERDQVRLLAAPALAERADWRTSRFLKQQVPPGSVVSLSHSNGAALVASSESDWAVGVDMEFIRQRDFAGLATWACSEAECAWLAQRGWQAVDFYRLWAVKEALIKAGGLDFPADLLQVGWRFDAQGRHSLHGGGRRWQGVSAVCAGWMLACVWPFGVPAAVCWQAFGAWRQRQPLLEDVVWWLCGEGGI